MMQLQNPDFSLASPALGSSLIDNTDLNQQNINASHQSPSNITGLQQNHLIGFDILRLHQPPIDQLNEDFLCGIC